MDKRTFGAFALIFAILMIFPYLNQKFFPAPLRPAGPDSTAVVVQEPLIDEAPATRPVATPPAAGGFTEIETPATMGPGTADEALRVPTGLEARVTVTTPLYRLEISSLGGRIVSWEGLEHKSWQGGVVQLVPADIPATGLDALVFRSGEMPLGQANYEIDQAGELNLLQGDGLRFVELSFQTNGGLLVRKIFI